MNKIFRFPELYSKVMNGFFFSFIISYKHKTFLIKTVASNIKPDFLVLKYGFKTSSLFIEICISLTGK